MSSPQSAPNDVGSAASERLRFTQVAFWAGPLAFLVSVLWSAQGAHGDLTPEAMRLLGVTAWMALWWVSETVPIAATSMLPLALFPLFEISTMSAVAAPYMHPLVILLMAGFMVALALERWELHRRVALRVLQMVGTSPRRLILGMMIASAGCSMWISLLMCCWDVAFVFCAISQAQAAGDL